MYCVKCGKDIEDGLELCDDCIFEEINKKAYEEETKPSNNVAQHYEGNKNSLWWVYLIAFFIPIYGVILAAGLLAKNEDEKAKITVIISVIPMIIELIIVFVFVSNFISLLK